MFRRNRLNNGRQTVLENITSNSSEPWNYQTGAGIFSSPVIGCNDEVLSILSIIIYLINYQKKKNKLFKTIQKIIIQRISILILIHNFNLFLEQLQ